jgi:hypothetical protein
MPALRYPMKQQLRTFPLVAWLVMSVATNIVTAAQTNFIVFDRLYEKYSVSEGRFAFAAMRLLEAQSVESFQRENSLIPDGVVGPTTWSKVSEALERKGSRFIKGNPSPLEIRIIADRDSHIGIEFHNASTMHFVIRVADSIGPKRTGIPLMIKVSGGDGRRFSGRVAALIEFDNPLHIQPRSRLQLLKRYWDIGKGASECRISMVATENERTIFLLESEPLLLNRQVAFQKEIFQ